MPKIEYVEKRFRASALKVIEQANAIIAEYQRQGFDLTLRQLYYQFVSRGFIPNSQREYKRLGETVSNARLAGLIDWEAIVDRTRTLRERSSWDSPQKILDSAAASYCEDLWRDQPTRAEVWIEKDALVGVIEKVCEDFRVPYFSCRGYTSLSELWAAARRIDGRETADGDWQETHVIHLGDHDPSGKDMSRDIEDRLITFDASGFTLTRIALNMDQVEKYNLPPNPAKLTDSRAHAYIAEYGGDSWELDALDPPVIAGLVRDAILKTLDQELWNRALEGERRRRRILGKVRDRWPEVEKYLAPEEPAA